MIPEYIPVTISITTGRPARWNTPLGGFEFRHVKTEWFGGYQLIDVARGQPAYIATPEKALLDLIYLHPGADSPAYLQELRLQNLDQLDADVLRRRADLAGSPKLQRAAAIVADLAQTEALEYQTL